MEKKKRLTNEEILNRRNYKRPNPIIYGLYKLIGTPFISMPLNRHLKRDVKISDCKGPCFLIYNHQSRIDHQLFMEAAWPKRVSILAGYSEFFRSHLHTVFKLNGILPKKMYTTDIVSLKAMKKVIKQNGCVAFSPEGTSSMYGYNQPVVPGTGHFLKHYGIPVYFLHIQGAYLTQNKVDNSFRKGRIETELSLLFSPEDLKNLTDEEINDKINEAFRHDDYLWNEERHIEFKPKKGNSMTQNLSDILYRCPKCNSLFTMKDSNDEIYCTKCGNRAMLDHYYTFHPTEGSIIYNPSRWSIWEREEIIKDIRKDPNYSFEVNCKLGFLPEYGYIKHHKTSIIEGEGKFIVDHSGVHFKGTRNNEPYSFDMSYKEIYTLCIMTDFKQFVTYVKGVYHEFIPEFDCAGYLTQLIEEMHRLHENTFKNFKWNEYMYEGFDK